MKNNNFDDSYRKDNKKFSNKKIKHYELNEDIIFKNKANKQFKNKKKNLEEDELLEEWKDYKLS